TPPTSANIAEPGQTGKPAAGRFFLARRPAAAAEESSCAHPPLERLAQPIQPCGKREWPMTW
ncbi:hypothetical protein, partial [Salmonella sp. SAL4458]|uniref:hypothetical protein n=1 Tax=Salmonella sp. SAL4458 TaxID=3159913 RepID=UPI00397D4119